MSLQDEIPLFVVLLRLYYFSILRPSALYRKLDGSCSFQHRAGDIVQEKKAGRDTFETETEVRVTAFVKYLTDVILVQEGVCQGRDQPEL